MGMRTHADLVKVRTVSKKVTRRLHPPNEEEVDLDWDPAAAGDCLENDDDDLADDFLADLADEVLGHSEDDLDQEAAARKHHRVETDTAR